MDKKRVIIGVSGASGICLADAVLRSFHAREDWETYLIVSRQAKRTIELEFAPGLSALEKQADVVCDPGDLACSVSSGTFRTEGMVIVPCSMKTLAGLVSGYSEDLLLRAADVVLKERRQLTLVPREAPLSVLHCRNLLSAAQLGCTIIPPVMSFYHRPETIDDLVAQVTGKILDSFGLYDNKLVRWKTPDQSGRSSL